ncbi:MAG: Hpt domain-containing protein [Rhizobiales bacterium]|nr:Hpt domain-containing protein [Hyphomicrobiales bacterium]
MIEFSTDLTEPISAPPLTPIERPIDLDHLSRMTLGDRSLEREVLGLFDRQAEMLSVRMHAAEPAMIAACAHTLKGSARGIGAWRVARSAEMVELIAATNRTGLDRAVETLHGSIQQARAVITDLLRAH